MKRSSNVPGLVLAAWPAHPVLMRIVPMLMLVGAACGIVPSWAADIFGLWKVHFDLSTGSRLSRENLTVRFEPHPKGEVFTLDRTDRDGRSTTSSTILYLDNKPRDFQDFGCSGTQSSRRLDSKTVEILRTCVSGKSTRFVRRLSPKARELVLEITEQQPDGRHFERRLVLEQSGSGAMRPK